MQFTNAIIALVVSMAATAVASPFPQGSTPPTCPSNGEFTGQDGSIWTLRDRTDWAAGITYGNIKSRADCIKAAVNWNRNNPTKEQAVAIVWNSSSSHPWGGLCWLKKAYGSVPCGTTHPDGSSAMIRKCA